MSWELPFAFGAEVTPTYAYQITRRVPPWLRRRVGGAILRAIGEALDILVARTGAGVALRFPTPEVDAGALAIAGRERRIVRGLAEPGSTYALRVQRWLDAHRHRGNVYELLEQWDAYNGTRRAIDVLYASGTLYKLYEVVSPIDRAIIFWGLSNSPRWAEAWCFLYEDADPGPLTDEQVAQLTLIPRLWNAAHMLPLHVIVAWPGARLWGFPDWGLTWAEQEAAYTWAELAPRRAA